MRFNTKFVRRAFNKLYVGENSWLNKFKKSEIKQDLSPQ